MALHTQSTIRWRSFVFKLCHIKLCFHLCSTKSFGNRKQETVINKVPSTNCTVSVTGYNSVISNWTIFDFPALWCSKSTLHQKYFTVCQLTTITSKTCTCKGIRRHFCHFIYCISFIFRWSLYLEFSLQAVRGKLNVSQTNVSPVSYRKFTSYLF